MRHFILLSFTLLSLHAMTLEESIAYALEHNNALKQADVSIERTKSVRDSKKARNFGRIDLLASYDHYNNARTLTPLTPMSIVGSPDGAYTIPTTKDMFNVGVVYNVTLFDGFALQSDYKISDLQYQNAMIKSHLGHEELIYNVRNLYISLLSLQEQLDAQQQYTESQQKLLERIKKERSLGSRSKLDVLKAQNSVVASQAQVATMEANIEIIKATLSALMGDKTFDKTSPVEIAIDVENSTDLTEIEITSLERYKTSEINIQASARKQDKSKSSYYPRVDFNAYYGQNFGPNDTTNAVPPVSTAPTAGQTVISQGDWNNGENWQVGIHLKWNLLDFGATSSINEEAELSYLQAKLESNGVKIELRKSIITAKNNIKLAMAQYNNATSQYELLSETEKIEQVRYDNNAVTLTDLLDTSAKKGLAYAQLINAKYNYQKAKYYIDYLLEKGDNR